MNWEDSKKKKKLANKWTGKTELLAGIPSEKPRRLIQLVQGKPLLMNQSWSSSPGSRTDECVFLFAKLPYLSNGISCSLPKPFSPRSHMYQGDPSKAKHQILPPPYSTYHGLTFKLFVTVHFLLCTSWSYVQSTLCTSQHEEQKMQFSHQLPQSPQWNLPVSFSTSQTSVEDTHTTPIWVVSTVAL